MKNTVSLVTGASRGFGAAVAETLADAGSHVVALARSAGALEELYDRIEANQGSSSLAVLDIADDNAVRNLCRKTYERWGRIDYLVHSAVFAAQLSPVPQSDECTLQRAMKVNLLATLRLIAHVEPLLRRSDNGTAIFFEDENAEKKFFGVYGSTKAAQISLAKSWQRETEFTDISVIVFRPKPMATATRATFFPGENPESLADPMDEARRLCKQLFKPVCTPF